MIIKSLVLTYGIACNLMYQLFLVWVRLEERDLENILPEYKQYKKDVPMFVPYVATRG